MGKKEIPIKTKATAFILRHKTGRPVELLVLSFKDQPFLPWRLPGGSVANGEDPLAAMHREVLEEAGLEGLEVARKLGVKSYLKATPKAYINRHDYLLWAPPQTPSQWEHRVTGKGDDAGEIFRYRWAAAGELLHLDGEFGQYLTAEYIPELFG